MDPIGATIIIIIIISIIIIIIIIISIIIIIITIIITIIIDTIVMIMFFCGRSPYVCRGKLDSAETERPRAYRRGSRQSLSDLRPFADLNLRTRSPLEWSLVLVRSFYGAACFSPPFP